MKKIQIGLIFTLFLYFPLNAQMISKWNMIFNGRELAKKYNLPSFRPSELTVYDKNHFGFLSMHSGEWRPYLSVIGVFVNGKDTNVLKLESGDIWSGFVIRGINYVDSTTIYCLVDSAHFAYQDGLNQFFRYISFVYKSTNGGKDWTRYPLQQDLSLRKRPSLFLRMTDSLHGILVQLPDTLENYDRILLTTDGWKTYKEVKTNKFYLSMNGYYSPPIIAVFTSLVFPREHQFWLSKDNGYSWDTLNFPNFSRNERNVYFVNDSLWLFSGYNKALNSNVLLKTSDFGAHWDTVLILPSVNSDDTLYMLLYPPLDEKHFTTIINRKYAYTESGGNLWRYITADTYHDGIEFIVLLSYYDGKIGYGVGSMGGLQSETVEMYSGDSTLAPPKFIEPEGYFKIPMNFAIKWSSIIGADSYRLQIAEGPGVDFNPSNPLPSFETDLILDTILVDTTFQMRDTKYYRTYRCRVLAQNEKYTSEWISKYFVTIQQPNSVFKQRQVTMENMLIQKHQLNWSGTSVLERLRGSILFNILGVPVCNIYSVEEIKRLPSGVYLLQGKNEFIRIMVLD